MNQVFHRATRLALALVTVGALFAQQDTFTGVERVVAVGDVHGDLNQLTKVLRDAGVIGADNKWSGGKTHLVQVGDLPDRGPDTRKIMDLLIDLEKQARKAGGAVHVLIGNHDAMNVYGDLRDVSPAEYAAFTGPKSEQRRAQAFAAYLDALEIKPDKVDPAMKEKWMKEHPLGWVEHREAWMPGGVYGSWVRRRNAAIKVNDTLFVHAGVSPKYAATTLKEINKTVRDELADINKIEGGMTADVEGPLWYRGFAQTSGPEIEAHLAAVLENFKVARIVIGHTPTAGAVIPRFNARVVVIDVGLSKVYGGPAACLLIEKGTLTALHMGQRLELPREDAGVLPYLRKAAELNPEPSRLKRYITVLEQKQP